jgi:hypothetical protein
MAPKTVSTKTNKNLMNICSYIENKYHCHSTGDFSHYATFFPHSKQKWYEKGSHWNKFN